MNSSNDHDENECRLCGEVSKSADMCNVFEKTDDGIQFVQLIKDFLPILIYRTDPLSKRICETCCTHLKKFHEFRRSCLAFFNNQKERLESKADTTENERLFLNALKNGIDTNIKNSLNDTTIDVEQEQSESELCAELQNAIKESLTQNLLKEKQQQQAGLYLKVSSNLMENGCGNFINGNLEDESSQESVFKPKVIQAESHSDMELCDSPSEISTIITGTAKKRMLADQESPELPVKRRKLIGPKSCIDRLRQKYGDEYVDCTTPKKEPLVYNPLSLLNCVLNCINKQILPDFVGEKYKVCTRAALEEWKILEDFDKASSCNYCGTIFTDLKLLAEHERQHIFVVVRDKVDSPTIWVSDEKDAKIRNDWLQTVLDQNQKINDDTEVIGIDLDSYEDENVRDELLRNGDITTIIHNGERTEEAVIEEDQSLLVPIEEKTPEDAEKGEVVLIDTIAMVNGTPLSEIPKDQRRTLFKSVTVNGVKRKFCPLCRYTFKDNWAIESHYFSSGCHYTCRFCGLRFNKQRSEFDEHIKNHILNGDKRTDKIFASRKAHLPPKVINQNRMKTRPPYIPSKPLPRTKVYQVKAMLEEAGSNSVQIKKEPGTDSPTPESNKTTNDTYKPQNQAYFCRKCYQVFFKLDEFNVHVVSCNGTGAATNTENMGMSSRYSYSNRNLSPPTQRQASYSNSDPADSGKSDSESYSPSGRPMRHCVKEAGPYIDDIDEMIRPRIMNSSEPTSRGYECSLCSSCFPTKYSRNSHMRIHKSDYQLKKFNDRSIGISRNRPNNVAKKAVNAIEQQDIPTFAKYINNVRIKQEPTEPIVEIHEGEEETLNIPSNIGSVSITPIPNANQKTNVDPDIIKLVQSNPNITIKTMSNKSMSEQSYGYMQNRSVNSTPISNRNIYDSTTPTNSSDLDNRCYRCSSCSKPFSNKSNLYFHKKNQCTGSKYPCPFCRKRFGTEAAYSSHIFYNHPE